MVRWQSLVDPDDLPQAQVRTRQTPQRSVAEALAFHRVQTRTEDAHRRTLARLTSGQPGASSTAPLLPQLARLHVAETPEPPPARPVNTRRTPGPAPPKSWLAPPIASGPAASRTTPSRSTAPATSRLPLEIDQFTLDHLPSYADLHPTRRAGPSRLLITALLLVLKHLSDALTADAQEIAREDVAGLPRHLRELVVWAVPNWLGRGIDSREVDALLWDVRDWGGGDDDDGSSDKQDDEGDAWDSDSSSPSTSFDQSIPGWTTFYLPYSTLPLTTLRLLLSPSPLPTPVTYLSLAHSCWDVEKLLPVIPEHVRGLSLEGVSFGRPGGGAVAEEARVRSLLIRLGRKTPLITVRSLFLLLSTLRFLRFCPLRMNFDIVCLHLFHLFFGRRSVPRSLLCAASSDDVRTCKSALVDPVAVAQDARLSGDRRPGGVECGRSEGGREESFGRGKGVGRGRGLNLAQFCSDAPLRLSPASSALVKRPLLKC